MSSSTTAGSQTAASTRLESMAGIAARYELPGPHGTVIVPVPNPGTVGDDRHVRWRATRADLRHLGVSALAIEHMDAVIASTHRRGHPLLLTANDDSAGSCWLSFDIEPSMHLGSLPDLVPAIRQVNTAQSSTIAAVIDRIGADIYSVDTFEINAIATVDGEDELIHKAASGGWSQKRQQRHSEVLWERNAKLVASHIIAKVRDCDASAILLTGDDRAVQLVEADLARKRVDTVVRCQAGGRHEPGTAERVRTAALDERAARAAAAWHSDLADLREELGQRDQAVEGAAEVLQAITEHRVATLFVDFADRRREPLADALVRAALAQGARVAVGLEAGVSDGVAAILRVPYPSPSS